MKTKTLLPGLLLLFTVTATNAQSLYFDLNAGYGLRLAPWQFGVSTYSTSQTTVKSHPISLGSGLNFGANAGYMLNDNLGLELGLSYLMNKFESESSYGYSNPNFYTSTDTYTYDWKTTMLRVMPSVRLMTSGEKMKVYSRFGLVFGMMAKSVQNTVNHEVFSDLNFPSNSSDDTYDETWEYKGGAGFGLVGSLGLMMNLSEKLGLFFEANAIGQSWSPKTGTLTKSTTNGVDNLPNMTTSDKEIEYVDEYSYSPSTPPSTGSPSKYLKDYYPMSCVSLTIGIHLSLGGGE